MRSQTHEEVNLEQWQRTLRRRDTDLYSDLAGAIRYGQARVSDLRRPVGADHSQPRPEPLRGRLDSRKSDHDDDLAHMRKVTGYVKRHLNQKPQHGVEDSRWRYSLMN